jgi:hypothetical protein
MKSVLNNRMTAHCIRALFFNIQNRSSFFNERNMSSGTLCPKEPKEQRRRIQKRMRRVRRFGATRKTKGVSIGENAAPQENYGIFSFRLK